MPGEVTFRAFERKVVGVTATTGKKGLARASQSIVLGAEFLGRAVPARAVGLGSTFCTTLGRGALCYHPGIRSRRPWVMERIQKGRDTGPQGCPRAA